ncbi:HBL297Cp [Eremothecium sinecaudum]|uniref:HBL297Cp n=1 Tax=Eremothecium sinecaudum TaxID=45286 RepID=A0A109UW36_9SACH|nr:HBL297Cp [Eremothecium sinecaudum]AMD18605.1 HBL297Cp [Eremothecium sinecaudum]
MFRRSIGFLAIRTSSCAAVTKPLYRAATPYFRNLPGVACSLHTNGYLQNSQKNVSDKEKGTHIASFQVEKPQLMIAFTCKKCDTRSSHSMSKQAYTKGTVLIQCPGCKNRHLIADHLKIFNDSRITIQDILQAKGESVSQNIDDLVFDDIPESLKKVIGHYAKDAPTEMREKLDNETVHSLPSDETKENKA